jgi:hypothetical protein
MQTSAFLFAYFGPEVQLPLISFLGAISGLVMVVGAKPIRFIKRWFRGRPRKATVEIKTIAEENGKPST